MPNPSLKLVYEFEITKLPFAETLEFPFLGGAFLLCLAKLDPSVLFSSNKGFISAETCELFLDIKDVT